jgi:RND family efflux transporter MFP subunit
LDSALSSLKGAEGDLLAQDQQVRSESVLLRYYKVVAAEEGTVGDVPVRVGDLVNTSTVLTTLDHNERLEAYVGVPVDHLGQLHKDLRVELLDDDGKPLAVTEVSFVSPEVAADQSVLVKSWVDNEAGRFRNNQLVRVRVVWAERQAPVIPVLAVQTRNGQNFAWVVKGDERTGLSVQERAIQVSAIQGQAYPIIKGLSVGERVVVSGLQKLHAGASVVEAPAASG